MKGKSNNSLRTRKMTKKPHWRTLKTVYATRVRPRWLCSCLPMPPPRRVNVWRRLGLVQFRPICRPVQTLTPRRSYLIRSCDSLMVVRCYWVITPERISSHPRGATPTRWSLCRWPTLIATMTWCSVRFIIFCKTRWCIITRIIRRRKIYHPKGVVITQKVIPNVQRKSSSSTINSRNSSRVL